MANERERIEKIKPPRVIFVRSPRGTMLGEPENVFRQRDILQKALEAIRKMSSPGSIWELPYELESQTSL